MMYYGNWSSLAELVNLPVGLRDFFFKKLIETKEREKEANSNKGNAKEATAAIANQNAAYQHYSKRTQ